MTAPPPSPEWPVEVPLPDGRQLVVRPVEAGDVDALIVLYAGLGDTDRHRRFFTQFRATRSWVVEWIRRCRDEGFAIVAVLDRPGLDGAGLVVGEAAYILQANGNGDFSLTVDADWRGWLGPFLLDLLVAEAATRGVPNLEADILTENRSMQAIARRRGAAIGPESDHSVVHVVIGTADRWPAWGPAGDRPRVLVEVPGGRLGHAREASKAGFEVLGCPGPGRRHGPCPALAGEPCPLASGADAIVVAMPPGTADELVAAHARLHPGRPVVVVRTGIGRPAEEPDGALDAGNVACRLELGSGAAVLVEALRHVTEGDLWPSSGADDRARDGGAGSPDAEQAKPEERGAP